MDWEIYDPTWLIDLAARQYPKESWLVESLSDCTRCLRDGDSYLWFIERERAKTPDSEWGFKHNMILKHHSEGEIVLDILRNNKVGGVEFMSKRDS